MALNNWPTELPDTFEVSGYTEELPDNTISTQPEAGFRQVRRRFTAAPIKITGSMIVDGTQKGLLDTFYVQQQAIRFQWDSEIDSLKYYEFAAPLKYTALSGLFFRARLELWKFTTETGGS